MILKEQNKSFRKLHMPMKSYLILKKETPMINMVKREWEDNLQDRTLMPEQECILAWTWMIYSVNSSEVVVMEGNNSFNSILEAVAIEVFNNNIINNKNRKKISSKTQMSLSWISIKFSNFIEEKRFGLFSFTKLKIKRVKRLRMNIKHWLKSYLA